MDIRLIKTKEKLKNALIQLMYCNELTDIHVSELVKLANCSRSTFYNHYSSIQEFLYEIIDDTLEEIKIQIRKPYIQLDQIDFTRFPKEDVSLFYYLKSNCDLFKVLMKEAKILDLSKFLADTIEELYVEEYEFEVNNPNVSENLYKVYAANGIASIIIRWMETGYKESPEFMADQAIELLKTAANGFSQKIHIEQN